MENKENKPMSLAEARKQAKERDDARKLALKEEAEKKKSIVETLTSGSPLKESSLEFQEKLRSEWEEVPEVKEIKEKKTYKVGAKKPFPTTTTDNKKGLIRKIIEIMETRENDLPMDWLRGKELEFRVISKRND